MRDKITGVELEKILFYQWEKILFHQQENTQWFILEIEYNFLPWTRFELHVCYNSVSLYAIIDFNIVGDGSLTNFPK